MQKCEYVELYRRTFGLKCKHFLSFIIPNQDDQKLWISLQIYLKEVRKA